MIALQNERCGRSPEALPVQLDKQQTEKWCDQRLNVAMFPLAKELFSRAHKGAMKFEHWKLEATKQRADFNNEGINCWNSSPRDVVHVLLL